MLRVRAFEPIAIHQAPKKIGHWRNIIINTYHLKITIPSAPQALGCPYLLRSITQQRLEPCPNLVWKDRRPIVTIAGKPIQSSQLPEYFITATTIIIAGRNNRCTIALITGIADLRLYAIILVRGYRERLQYTPQIRKTDHRPGTDRRELLLGTYYFSFGMKGFLLLFIFLSPTFCHI